jgi:PIN domain nuclease of toxin-antitoxin system
VRLLLDTHIVLWWLAGRKLEPLAGSAIADPANEVYVSAVSAWEMSIKTALGKLRAPSDLESVIDVAGFIPLSVTLSHGLAAGALPRHHEDPFDRMLIAQARAEALTIATRDPQFDNYEVAVLRT